MNTAVGVEDSNFRCFAWGQDITQCLQMQEKEQSLISRRSASVTDYCELHARRQLLDFSNSARDGWSH